MTFRLSEQQGNVDICIHDFAPPLVKEIDIRRLFNLSEFSGCRLLEENIPDVLSALPADEDQLVEDSTLDEPLSFVIAEIKHGVLEMEVSSDFMEVVAHYTTPVGGKGVTLEEIVKKLKGAGAVKGINKEAIRHFFDRVQREPPGESFAEVLAEGLPAEQGSVSTFEFFVVPLQERVLTPQNRGDGTLDMHELGDIETVEKGDHLARRVPSTPGANGYTVHGEVIYSIAPDNIPFDVGDGASTSPEDANLLIATRAGVPLKLANGLAVSEMLILKNVDLTTGNIEYDGTIMVSGNVKGGMLVKATKDVIVNGFVESGMIDAGGNIVVQQGVIGRELEDSADLDIERYSSKLIAGHDISARYAQSSYLQAGNDINVVTQILHCHVKANHGVYVGNNGQKKSKLLGGVVHAGKEIMAGEIGAISNVHMTLDFSHRLLELERKYKAASSEHSVKKELIQGLREALEELKTQQPTPELVRHCKKIVNTIDIVKQEVVSINLDVESYKIQLAKLRDGIRVRIYGRLFPGADFVICDKTYNTKEERGSCDIRFIEQQMIFE
mgnify:CR=1 FL=1